ncbi:MAG: class I SAM-dependent rRNA methyltransferase [Eubacteriales bacterium]|nr:class I SAM-dependent rRNA methyltransferase [Eubacteriales bacterium]
MDKKRQADSKRSRPYPAARVSEKAEESIRKGHPWIYDTEIISPDRTFVNGQLADVLSKKGRYLGTGFFNNHSKIRIRLISGNANDRFDEAFYERRLRYAVDYRRTVMGGDFKCCRLIFGESDQFPGFIVDRFENIIVAQTLSLGIELIKPMLFRLLIKILRETGENIDAVYERNDVPVRELEGLEQKSGFFSDERDTALGADLTGVTQITENGILFNVDYARGQKTGFFLDQKYNRQAVARLSQGKRVLDCFTHTGAFALNAAKAGAEFVSALDISEDAIRMAKDNAALNDMSDKIVFDTVNVFDYLTELAGNESAKKNANFDFMILDPPAFTKNRISLPNAIRGYKEINLKAMKILPRGGYLATCSCSHFMTAALFGKMLSDAAMDASVSLRQIEVRQQSPDHPVLWSMPETDYLQFYIFQIV